MAVTLKWWDALFKHGENRGAVADDFVELAFNEIDIFCCFPVSVYPTEHDLPCRRTEIPIWP